MAKLSIKMIEMYTNMINEQFQPLFTQLNNREIQIKKKVETEVKKELGIYKLYVRFEELKLEMAEIKRQLKGWEETVYDSNTMRRESPIDSMVRERMDKIQNGYKKKLTQVRDELIFAIKLSGVDDTVKETFARLPRMVAKLTKEAKKLPPINKTVKMITAKTK